MKTVLIHGLGQDASAWKDVIPLLPDKNVLTMDLSELIGSGTWQELSNGFAARIDSLEEPVLLCGISLGAVLALDYAAGNPGKVRSMLLIAPQYKMPVLLLKFQALPGALLSCWTAANLPKFPEQGTKQIPTHRNLLRS